MCNFRIGQKVVCVESPNPLLCQDNMRVEIKKGDVLTINYVSTGFWTYLGFDEVDQDALYLSGLFRPLESTYTEEEIEAVNIDELVCPELEPV